MSSKALRRLLACLATLTVAICFALWFRSALDVAPTLVLRHPHALLAVAFSPDGRMLATAGGPIDEAGKVVLWDLASGEEQRCLAAHAGSVQAVAFSPDGNLLASAGSDGFVRLWDPTTGKEEARLPCPTDGVTSLAFTADRRTLAAIGIDRTLHLWDPATGRQRGRWGGATVLPPSQLAGAMALSPDGRTMLTSDRAICLRDAASGQETARLEAHASWVNGLALSADGRLLASVDFDGVAQVWDLTTRRRLFSPQTGIETVILVALSADGRQLATVCQDHAVCVWDTTSGRLLERFHGHSEPVTAIAFSPDGKAVASASHDQTVHLWPAPR